eukprot:6184720-Pleurochrysis_carterae.AAC.2
MNERQETKKLGAVWYGCDICNGFLHEVDKGSTTILLWTLRVLKKLTLKLMTSYLPTMYQAAFLECTNVSNRHLQVAVDALDTPFLLAQPLHSLGISLLPCQLLSWTAKEETIARHSSRLLNFQTTTFARQAYAPSVPGSSFEAYSVARAAWPRRQAL